MKPTPQQALAEGAIAGSAASLFSLGALAVAGRMQNRAAAAPVNAVSHWLWGSEALRRDRPSWRHTATGLLVHHGAALFWGVLHAGAWGTRPQAKRPGPALAGAAAATAVACFVDYRLTPKRLTPGFEHRLSTGAMVGVYAAFALGLAVGSVLAPRLRRSASAEGPAAGPVRRVMQR